MGYVGLFDPCHLQMAERVIMQELFFNCKTPYIPVQTQFHAFYLNIINIKILQYIGILGDLNILLMSQRFV